MKKKLKKNEPKFQTNTQNKREKIDQNRLIDFDLLFFGYFVAIQMIFKGDRLNMKFEGKKKQNWIFIR